MADELDDDLPGEEPTPKPKPAAKTKPPAAAPEPEPAKHVHTQRLTKVALDMGFTQADLDGHSSEVIWEEIHRLNALAAEQEKARHVPVAAAVPKTETPAEDDEDAFISDLEKNPDIDQRYVKKLKKDRERIKALEDKVGRVDQLEAAEKARAGRLQTEMIDTGIAALGEEFESLVGTESMAETTDPGHKGWRIEIYKNAGIDFAKDSQRVINKKIAAAAAQLAAGRITKKEEPANEYDQPAKREPGTGRFTKKDFERGAVSRPSAKKVGATEINGTEAIRQHFAANGDPRGSKNYTDPDDTDDLPG